MSSYIKEATVAIKGTTSHENHLYVSAGNNQYRDIEEGINKKYSAEQAGTTSNYIPKQNKLVVCNKRETLEKWNAKFILNIN